MHIISDADFKKTLKHNMLTDIYLNISGQNIAIHTSMIEA